jgi:bifunctional DNA-binding transcriptional regulator/antitoxin component of YhaV-PrlF toxin-antitoxin module
MEPTLLLTAGRKKIIVPAIQYFWKSRSFYMRSTTVQIRQRGTLTLPAKLRAKYRLDEGDSLAVLDLDGSILLSPKIPVVPKLAAEIERLREAAGLELKDLFPSSPHPRAKRRSARKPR